MAQGRAVRELKLSDDERETLERWGRRRMTAQALAMRCRIVLACAEGGHNGGDSTAISTGRFPRWGRQAADASRSSGPS